jgi:hypothetical protein
MCADKEVVRRRWLRAGKAKHDAVTAEKVGGGGGLVGARRRSRSGKAVAAGQGRRSMARWRSAAA